MPRIGDLLNVWRADRYRNQLLLLVTLVISLQGCHSVRRTPPILLRVHVSPKLNQDRPVPVDLVATSDKNLSAILAKTAAPDWFAKKNQFRGDYPEKDTLEVWSWEWVPGQTVDEIAIRPSRKPRVILVFANYSPGGVNRARIGTEGITTLTLGETELQSQLAADGASPTKFILPKKKKLALKKPE